MKPIVFLEGPDGGGKTTLFELILNRWPYLKADRLAVHGGGKIDDQMELVKRFSLVGGGTVRLFDRSVFISEMIYGKLRESGPIISDETLLAGLRSTADMFRVAVVFCLPDFYSIQNLKPKAHKDPAYVEQIKQNHASIVKQYEDAFSTIQIHLPKVTLIRHNWMSREHGTNKTVESLAPFLEA